MNLNVDGVNLYCEVHGEGAPVLLIHGFPLSGQLWAPLIQPLANDFRLIIPDLRGMGRSETVPESSMAQYARDQMRLLEFIGEQRPVVVCGLSMGGYIAFEFFRRYASRVRGLVLADTRAEADDETAAQGREQTAQQVVRDGSGLVADTMLDKLFAPQSPQALREEWRRIMASTAPTSIAAALRAMEDRADSRETLLEINVPAMIIVGEEDSLTPPSTARVMHQCIGGSQLKIIPDAGHMTPVEQPSRFARVLRQFLESLPPIAAEV